MAAALGLSKLGKHIKDIPTVSVKGLWRQADSTAATELQIPALPDFEQEQPLSPHSVAVRDEAKQATLQVRLFGAQEVSTRPLQTGWKAAFLGLDSFNYTVLS